MPKETESVKEVNTKDEELVKFSAGEVMRRGDDFHMSQKNYAEYLTNKGCPKDIVQKLWDAQDELAAAGLTELVTPRLIEVDRPVAFYAGTGNGKLRISELPQRTTEINIPGREPKTVTKYGATTYGITRTTPSKWYEKDGLIDQNTKLVRDSIAARAAKALKK